MYKQEKRRKELKKKKKQEEKRQKRLNKAGDISTGDAQNVDPEAVPGETALPADENAADAGGADENSAQPATEHDNPSS